jgi:hypothetical protein
MLRRSAHGIRKVREDTHVHVHTHVLTCTYTCTYPYIYTQNETPLHCAAANGRLEIVQYLIENANANREALTKVMCMCAGVYARMSVWTACFRT